MHLHRNSDTSVAHWHDTVKVSQHTSWPWGTQGRRSCHCFCGTICNDVHCPNAVGGSRDIHRNHIKCWPARHGLRTRMRHSVPLRVRSLHLHLQAVQRGLFLRVARAAVRRHISATKSCREASLGFREVHVEARAGDVMAGAGGAAGPAPDVRHQPPVF